MKIITNRQFHDLITDIETQSSMHPSFTLFNGPKIKMLIDNNKIRIQSMQEFLVKIMNEFSKKDETGQVIVTTHPNGRQELAFENELDKKAYLDEYEKWATKTFQLNF
jgi:hypothetical protein